jgi:hypothetical protein
MPSLFRTILVAALGINLAAALYAADAQTNAPTARTTLPYDGYKVAMKKCSNLPETGQAKCIVNIRPAESSSEAGPASTASDANTVRDGAAQKDAEYAAA